MYVPTLVIYTKKTKQCLFTYNYASKFFLVIISCYKVVTEYLFLQLLFGL